MKIQLSDSFTYKKLILFTIPSIAMMVFSSIYGIIDGYFISNFIGDTEFAAVNFIIPFTMILGSFGFMFGSGGSALIAKTLGMGEGKKANSLFSLFVYIILITSLVLGVLGIIFIKPIAIMLGAEGKMIDSAVSYGRILLISLPFCMAQIAFQSFFPLAEKPHLGFIITVIAGITNIVLDALFIVVFKWGVVGAAVATSISQVLGGLLPILYFVFSKNCILRIGKTRIDFRSIGQASTNGMSEFLSNIAMSLVSMIFNSQLMKYEGEKGVATYGVLMYVGFIFFAVFIGYSMGAAPVIGYHYGAENKKELKGVLKRSLVIVGILSVVMVISSLLLSYPLSKLYVGYNEELMNLTVRAFKLFSFVFLFSGISIFGSSFFTSLNNGFISALISFLRTIVFQVIAIFTLPLIMGTDGIWLSIVFGDFAAALVAVICLLSNKKRYGY